MRKIAAGNDTGSGARWCVFRAADIQKYENDSELVVVAVAQGSVRRKEKKDHEKNIS